jgi:hypothetical protein
MKINHILLVIVSKPLDKLWMMLKEGYSLGHNSGTCIAIVALPALILPYCNGQQYVGQMPTCVYVILRSVAEPVLSEAEGKNPVSGKRRSLFCRERDPSRSLS